MKKLVFIFLLLICGTVFSQTVSSAYIIPDDTTKVKVPMDKAGSCGSPDGSMNVTTVVPPSYAWLQANGYCNPSAYGTNPTVCWTFTPTSSSVSINSGYSTTGCVNISHGPFTLYGPGCVFFGNGLNFTGLTPGLQYTWCMTSAAWGGGPGCIGFTDYCPYFFNNVVLPIDLLEFEGYNKDGVTTLTWKTATEINNDYFTLYRSRSGENWDEIAIISGSGNSNVELSYKHEDRSYVKGQNYYQLKQTDFNGQYETFNKIVGINTIVYEIEKPEYQYNLLGQRVKDNYLEFRVLVYKDGRRVPWVGELK